MKLKICVPKMAMDSLRLFPELNSSESIGFTMKVKHVGYDYVELPISALTDDNHVHMRLVPVLLDDQGNTIMPKSVKTTRPNSKKPSRNGSLKPRTRPSISGKRRIRLTKEQIEGFKTAVLTFLKETGPSTRKEIMKGTGIPTPSLYSSIMAGLRRKVKAKGEKALRVYSVR